jgi:hypothetical protein
MKQANTDPDRVETNGDIPASPDRGGQNTSRGPRVALIVVPLVVLLFIAAILFFGVYDGPGWLTGLIRPSLVHTEVRVTFRGEPLPEAVLITRPTREGLQGALGMPTDELGRYVLQTDLDGRYQEGAYPGRHKVTVARYGPSTGPSPPPLLTPQRYSSLDTTDLIIEVSRDPELNQFELKLGDNQEADADGDGMVARQESTTSLQGGVGGDRSEAVEDGPQQ